MAEPLRPSRCARKTMATWYYLDTQGAEQGCARTQLQSVCSWGEETGRSLGRSTASRCASGSRSGECALLSSRLPRGPRSFFEPKTPIREADSGPCVGCALHLPSRDRDGPPVARYTLLGDVFCDSIMSAFLPEGSEDAGTLQRGADATTGPTELNPFPDVDFESPGHELYACCAAGKAKAVKKLLDARPPSPHPSAPRRLTLFSGWRRPGLCRVQRILPQRCGKAALVECSS